jgi:hypothetical protein
MARLPSTAPRFVAATHRWTLLLALGALSLLFAARVYAPDVSGSRDVVASASLAASFGIAPAVSAPASDADVDVPPPDATLVAEVAPPLRTEATPEAEPVAQAATLAPADRWHAPGIDLVFEGQEWDEQSLANVNAALAALPPRLFSSLGNASLGRMHILVNKQGRTLSGTQPYSGAANFYSTNNGINELVLYPRQSPFTVLHELGHAYNLRHTTAGRYALVLLDAEMQSFMAATGWRVLSSDDEVRRAIDHLGVRYGYDGDFVWSGLSHIDPLEDFANCFAVFFLDPGGLRALSPVRYDWFAANVGR